MKKICIIIIAMFLGVSFVYAKENIDVKVVGVSSNSVTLKVMVDDYDNNLCYLYRSLDNLDYEVQMVIDCNTMYVDKTVDSGITYYYKASYGDNKLYSKVVDVTIGEGVENNLKISRNVNDITKNGIVFVGIFGVLMIISLIYMLFLKKKQIN